MKQDIVFKHTPNRLFFQVFSTAFLCLAMAEKTFCLFWFSQIIKSFCFLLAIVMRAANRFPLQRAFSACFPYCCFSYIKIFSPSGIVSAKPPIVCPGPSTILPAYLVPQLAWVDNFIRRLHRAATALHLPRPGRFSAGIGLFCNCRYNASSFLT